LNRALALLAGSDADGLRRILAEHSDAILSARKHPGVVREALA